MGLSFLGFSFCFDFPASVVCAGSCGKAERPPETRHDCAVFFGRLPAGCKKSSIVLEVTNGSASGATGDKRALEKLFPLVQPELHRLAHHYMSRERAGHTLQTTAILNEAYLRLVDNTKPLWQGRTHFIAAAA
jgi:hypothetical protein